MLKRLITLAALCGLFSQPVLAGSGTVTGKDAGGTVRTWDVITDGSGNFVWMNGICDGTAAAQCAAVKAASTAAGAADPAMVVAISPNNSVAVTAASLPLPTGASTSAKQPALGTAGTASSDVITVQGIASMTALAVSAAALPLPTGAATSAKQPALGAAGAASTDVITVQGIASMTALAVSAASLPLPTGAATSALQTTGNSALTTINTTLGTPMQNSGGSVTANAGTNLNTSALATSANQPTNASAGSTTSGQTGNIAMGAVTTSAPSYTTGQTDALSLDTSGNLRINCITGCSSSGGSSLTDEGTFTQGTTAFTAIGGIFNNSISNLTTGQAGAVQLTADRNMFVNLNKVAGTVLGAPSNYGTSPGAVEVMGVNAFVTNANGNGQALMANSSPVVIASNQSAVSVNTSSWGGTAVVANPCLTGTISYIPISQATSTQLASLGGSSKKNYVCALAVVGSDAENVSLVEGTGTVCATTPAAIIGGTTAANGLNMAANGGITLGNGAAPVAAGSLTSLNNVCLFQSGSGRVSGTLVLAQQ